MGLLTNMFMKRPGVVRSLHPTHSIAAIGKGIGIAQEANRLNLEETVENVQLTELRTRGGVAFNQSRRGE